MSDSASQRNATGQGTSQSGRYLWVVLPLVTGVSVTLGLMRQSLPVLYPFIQSEFGLSRAQVGLITSFLSAGTVIMAIVAGWLTDIFGVKRMITVATLMIAAFTMAFPLAYSFPFILGLVLVMGIVGSPLATAPTRAVIDWFPIRIRALAMSVKQMGIPVAGALTAAALPALAVATGWRVAVAITGVLVLLSAIAFILFYRDAPRSGEAAPKLNLAVFKTMFWNRSLVITILWGSIFIAFQFIVLTYFMLFLIEELGLSPIMAGGLLAIVQVGSIIGRVTWGAVSDFIFRGRRIVVLALSGFLTIFWMLGASLIDGGVPSITVYLLAVAIGISTMAFQGVLMTSIGEQSEPGQVGVTVGVASTLFNVSKIGMTPLFGYLVDISSSYSLGWRTIAAVALVGTLALLAFGREPQPR